MRIAFLVTSYPALSATFIQNQITGLVESGHEVDIFGDRPGETERMHDDVTRLNLLARTHAPKMPATALRRALKAPLPLLKLALHK
ncbi:MAG: hypothetical protein KC983_10825, partial [Phycisphaerales bacterium]|nr:hypothetical protein [Phycisphaerales bacterium]